MQVEEAIALFGTAQSTPDELILTAGLLSCRLCEGALSTGETVYPNLLTLLPVRSPNPSLEPNTRLGNRPIRVRPQPLEE